MSELVAEASNNAIEMKLYAGGQLGEEKDTLEITIFGGIDLNRVNLAPLNSIAPKTSVLGLPFLFRSVDHMRAVVDGPIGDEILAALEPFGLIGLAFYDSGARSFYNNQRPIRTLQDLAGMKVRVQNSPLAIAMVQALGANPTPMGFGQVYESLMLGTIDGSENNWPSYENTRHFEAARYYTLTRHTMMPEILVMSKYRWDQLSSEQQQIIKEAAKESVPHMRKKWDARVEESRQRVLANDTEIIETLDLAPFVQAMSPVYEQFADTKEMQDLIQRILATGVQ